jgi:hypothetical protein
MDDTVLTWHLGLGEFRVVGFSNSGLSEVDHRYRKARVQQLHSGELSKSATETVTGGFDCVGGVNGSQTLNFL